MDYNEFVDNIKKRLTSIFNAAGQNVTITVEKVLKNNGIELTGMNIVRDNKRISPTIYINDFYRDDIDEYDMESVVRQIREMYDSRCGYADTLEDKYVNIYCDYEKIKSRIIYKLVNLDMNREKLESVPYLPFNDLAITFRYMAYKGDQGIASSIISNDDITRWNVNISDLYNLAKKNTSEFFPSIVKKITTLLEEHRILPEDNVYDMLEDKGRNVLYVLSNEDCVNGATCMLYDGMLDKCAEITGDNIFIMPSSIHEVIFTGEKMVDSPSSLKEIVREANDSVVNQTEILSYNVYYYNRKNRTLKIV
jgi:hypothetical protein